jgi:hypothetical protein
MSQDPISDNETDTAIILLTTGKASDEIRDKATAALLHGLQKLGGVVNEMRSSLWTAEDLNRLIDARHNEACRNCPAKKSLDEINAKKAQKLQLNDMAWRDVAMMLLKYGGWIIIIIGSICGVKLDF